MSESQDQTRAVAVRETLAMSGGVPAIQNMAEVVSIAQLMARSGIAIRKHLREQPGACLGVALQAFRWEMDPYMVGNKSYAVNDQLAYEAQLLAAVVLTRAAILEEPDYEFAGEPFKDRTCTVSFKMRSGKTLSYTTPPTNKISPKNSPLWKTDEDQQLGYYAVRSWARRHQPHVLLGVYTPEEASEIIDVTPQTSGVMARLSGEQTGDGFNHDHVQSETEADARAPGKRTRKPRAEAVSPDAPEDPAPPTGEGAPATEEPKPDAPGPETQTASQAVSEALDGDDLPDALKGDPDPERDPQTETPVDESEEQEDEPESEAVDEPEVEAEAEGEALPAEFQTFVDAIETAQTFSEVKLALSAFFNTPTFKAMPLDQQNHVRYQTWATLEDRKAEGTFTDLPDHAADVSAFRLWLEAQDDADAITGTLAVLEQQPAFSGKDEAFKAGIRKAATDRIALVK